MISPRNYEKWAEAGMRDIYIVRIPSPETCGEGGFRYAYQSVWQALSAVPCIDFRFQFALHWKQQTVFRECL